MPAPLTLTELDHLPAGLLDCPARELHRLLPGPTLIHLDGRRRPALFVSVLLHGNEDGGLVALQQVLRAHSAQGLPRALSLLIGNVAAARQGLRRLDGQPDYNRVWPGADEHIGTPEHRLMGALHTRLVERGLFAAVDLHNNTGTNPHYAIVNRLDTAGLHLARLFSRTVVLFRGVPGTQTAALAAHCPAVAVESGKPGVPANEAAAARFLSACLHLGGFPAHALPEADIDLYHSVARVKLREEVSLYIEPAREGADPSPSRGETGHRWPADLVFDARLDHRNFLELEAGALLGHTRHPMPVEARDEAGRDVSADFFTTTGGRLCLARPAMPAMLTLDERVLRQDCLCYLMERVPTPRRSAAPADGARSRALGDPGGAAHAA